MAETTLDPASPSGRLAQFFSAHPDEVLTRRDVATKLGIAAAGVERALDDGLCAGLLARGVDAQLGAVWRAGPRLAASLPEAAP